MKVRQLGTPAQIRHVARIRLTLLLVVQEELHDVLRALRHRAAGMQHRALAVDDGAADAKIAVENPLRTADLLSSRVARNINLHLTLRTEPHVPHDRDARRRRRAEERESPHIDFET